MSPRSVELKAFFMATVIRVSDDELTGELPRPNGNIVGSQTVPSSNKFFSSLALTTRSRRFLVAFSSEICL